MRKIFVWETIPWKGNNMLDSFYKFIEPIPEGTKRPLWSVLVPTYNCANYLKETLISILQQDPGSEKMEILVVDDHSTKDDPKKIVQEVGKGRVKFLQQPQNVGKVKNYEKGLQQSKGILIHQLHGDDKVRPGFYKNMEDTFSKFPEVSAAFCRSIYIDEKGIWKQLTGIEQYNTGILENAFQKLLHNQIIQTPSMVVKREVYETIGCFDRRFDCLEDWEMWLRIAYNYKVGFVNEVLAEYRIHENNATNKTLINGILLKTHKIFMDIIKREYKYPDNIKKKIKRAHAEFLLATVKSAKIDFTKKLKYLKYILRLSANPKMLYKIIH